MRGEQAIQANYDEVKSDDIVEQARNQQNQNPGYKREERFKRDIQRNIHKKSSPLSKLPPRELRKEDMTTVGRQQATSRITGSIG
jgi:hypothetical protein